MLSPEYLTDATIEKEVHQDFYRPQYRDKTNIDAKHLHNDIEEAIERVQQHT